jgi:hypothetical protein
MGLLGRGPDRPAAAFAGSVPAALGRSENLELLYGKTAGRDFVVLPPVHCAKRHSELMRKFFLGQSHGVAEFLDLIPFHEIPLQVFEAGPKNEDSFNILQILCQRVKLIEYRFK